MLLTAVAVVLLSAVCVGGVSGETWDKHKDTSWGSDYGTSSVFYIYDAGDLAQFSDMVNSGKDFAGRTIYLKADIDLADYRWTSIGRAGSYFNYPFRGTFDGQGYTISNIKQLIGQYAAPGGLFGYVESGTVTNVKLQNVEITVRCGGIYVGSLVAVLKDGSVTNCDISGVNIMEPVDTSSEFSYSTYVVTVDDVIGDIRGTNEFIYGITATKIAISYDKFTPLNVPINYQNGANHQPRGLRYEVIIPAQLVIPEDTKTGTLTLTPQVLRILDTGRVDVSVESKYNFNLAYVGNDAAQISYELMKKDGTRIEQNSVVAGFTLENSDAVSLTATLTGHPPFVGSYTDILTFTIEYIDPIYTQN